MFLVVSLWENKHCGEAPFPKLSAVRRKSQRKRSPVQVKAFLPWLQYLQTYCCILLKSSGFSSQFSRFWREVGLRMTNLFV